MSSHRHRDTSCCLATDLLKSGPQLTIVDQNLGPHNHDLNQTSGLDTLCANEKWFTLKVKCGETADMKICTNDHPNAGPSRYILSKQDDAYHLYLFLVGVN